MGVGVRETSCREREREGEGERTLCEQEDRVLEQRKKQNSNAKSNKKHCSLRTNTQTRFSYHQYHGPFAAMLYSKQKKGLKHGKGLSNAPRKRSKRPGISKSISTPDPRSASRPVTAPPQPRLTTTTTTVPPQRRDSARYETRDRDESRRHET